MAHTHTMHKKEPHHKNGSKKGTSRFTIANNADDV